MNQIVRKLLYCLFTALLLTTPRLVSAQYFTSGQDPAAIKWRQINTVNFQILYPSDYETQAQRVAHVFERVYNYSSVSLPNKPKKITVILHTRVLKSNGFVAWAPSRVELFPTPHQEIYAQDWIEQLATHELRHHVQIDKIESEIPAIFKILLGEQAASLVIGAYLPFWFLEGDAVVTETALSRSGRGRLPSFSMELKAQVDAKGIYSFDKAYLGSFTDYTPDYYQLGYQIVSNIRSKNGGEVWNKVLHHIARHPLSLTPLSRGLKLATGKNQDEHYMEIMNNLRASNPFGFNTPEDNRDPGKQLVKPSKYYTSYRFPFFVDDSTFVAEKTPIDNVPSIVLVDKNKGEKRLFTPGTIEEESMNYSNGKIIWIEAQPDIRWTNKERTLMRILDIRNGDLREKIFDEKLFAPAISPDGYSIAAIKFNDQNQCAIVLLDFGNLQIVNEFKAKNYNTFLTPSWASDQKSLYAIALGPIGKSIVQLNLTSGDLIQISKSTYGEIKKPVQQGDLLYFTSDLNGKNEGYALDLSSKKVFLVLSAKYGVKDLQCSVDGRSFLYSDYTADGFKTARKEVSRATWTEKNPDDHFQDTLATRISAQEKGIIDFSGLDTTRFVSRKYARAKNLINIHSWSPVYIDPENLIVNTGFSVISQNKLATTIAQAGYDYSTINHTGKWIGKIEFAGWFPVLRLDGDYGKENSSYYQINRHYSSKNVLLSQDTVLVPFSQKVMNLHFDVAIPLNLSHGNVYRSVEPEFQIGYSHNWVESTTPSTIFRGSYVPLTYRLYAYNVRQQSLRAIQTRWGQTIDLKYRHTPFGDKQLGTIISAAGIFYLPGLFQSNGIKIYGAYQQKNNTSGSYFFNDLIAFPRGYATLENKELFTLRSDYVFPLACPDWHLWHLYYLKRIALRLHYDFAKISMPIHQSSSTINKVLTSTGAELSTECHFLRFIAPVKMGFRESYLIESKMYTSEFTLSMNLKAM